MAEKELWTTRVTGFYYPNYLLNFDSKFLYIKPNTHKDLLANFPKFEKWFAIFLDLFTELP